MLEYIFKKKEKQPKYVGKLLNVHFLQDILLD